MRRYICIMAAVTMLALTSIAVIGGVGSRVTAFASFTPVVEVTLASDRAVDVRLVAVGGGMGMSWYIIGQFEFPNYIRVSRLVVESSPGGSIRCIGLLMATDLRHGGDSPTLETFAFGVHAGALRRVIDADGMARLTIYGQNAHVTVDMRPDGEDTVLDALLNLGERES